MYTDTYPDPFDFFGGGSLPTLGIMMSVPGREGNPPSIRIVRPAVRSWLTCARRACSYTATLAAASMRAGRGIRRSRIMASKKSLGERSGSLYSWSISGGSISGSFDLGIGKNNSFEKRKLLKESANETWHNASLQRALRPLGKAPYHNPGQLTSKKLITDRSSQNQEQVKDNE